MWKCVFGHSKFLGCTAILAVRKLMTTSLAVLSVAASPLYLSLIVIRRWLPTPELFHEVCRGSSHQSTGGALHQT